MKQFVFTFSRLFVLVQILLCWVWMPSPIAAQGSVGIKDTPTNPDASAMLDVQSTSKGMLVPRMSTTQRNLISNPALGLLVFDTTTETFWFRDSGGWVELGGESLWQSKGDTIIYTPDRKVAIGSDSAKQALQVSGNIRVQEKEAFNGNDGGFLMYDLNGVERVHLNKVYSTAGTDFRVEVKVPDQANDTARVQFFRNTTARKKVVQIFQGKGNTTISAQIGADGQNSFFQADGGNFGIGTNTPSFLLDVNGVAAKSGGGSWVASSDRRLKQDIRPYSDGLAGILKINPIRYHYNEKSGYDTQIEHVGVIAQELQETLPYMVMEVPHNQSDGTKANYLSVDNSAMVYMLINATKEQQALIEGQKTEITELKAQLAGMQLQMQTLLSEVKAMKASVGKKDEGK